MIPWILLIFFLIYAVPMYPLVWYSVIRDMNKDNLKKLNWKKWVFLIAFVILAPLFPLYIMFDNIDELIGGGSYR